MVQLQIIYSNEVQTSLPTLVDWKTMSVFFTQFFVFGFASATNLLPGDRIILSGTDYDGEHVVLGSLGSTGQAIVLQDVFPGAGDGTGGSATKVETVTSSEMLTVKEGTSVPINMQISDIKDPSTRKGGYTKTVTLLGDNTTNHALGNIFDVNIVRSTFNRFAKTECNVIEDDGIIFSGYMRMLSINKVSKSNDTMDEEIEYEVTVADSASSFFQALGDLELTDLSYDELDHPNNVTTVMDSISNTYSDGYKYCWPMSSTVSGNYQLEDFLLAVYAKSYWDKIFASVGFSYTWASQNDDDIQFNKLLIPYNGSIVDPSKLLTMAFYNVDAYDSAITSTPVQIPFATQSWTQGGEYIVGNELLDESNSYQHTTGVYTIPYNLTVGKYFQFTYTIDYSIVFTNNEAGTVYLRRDTEGTGSQAGGFGFAGRLFIKNGSTIIQSAALTSFNKISSGLATNSFSLSPGATTVFTSTGSTTHTMINNAVNYPVTSQFTQAIGFATNPYTANQAFWSTTNAGTPAAARLLPADIDFHYVINSITMKIVPPINVDFTGTKYTKFYVPKKVKARDLIKSIMTMFNLYADVDSNTDKHIVFTKRDTYYDGGAVKDWTDKIVMDEETRISFASEESSRDLILTYKEATDDINKGYTDSTNEVYGEADFTFSDENIKGETKMEVIFEPMPITKNDPKGMYVLGVRGQEPKTGVRIVYDGGERNSDTSYGIYSGTTLLSTESTYNYTGHFDDPITPQFDLNFNLCQRYFYNDLSYFTNSNLFNLHWRRTLEQIDKGRVMLAMFNLDQADILNLKLNDNIYIKDAYWNILSVNDYDAGNKGPTQVKLITIDESQTLTGFSIRTPIVVPYAEDTSRKRAEGQNLTGANYSVSLGSLMLGENNYINPFSYYNLILGNENNVTGTNNLIIGNGMEINDTGSIFVNNGNFSMYHTYLTVTSPEVYESFLFANIDYLTESFSWGFRDGDVGQNSVVLNGESAQPNEASGIHTLAQGFGSTASGVASVALNNSIASGDYAMSGGKAATAEHWAEWARSSSLGGQYGFLSYITVTLDDTEKEMNLDGNLFIDGFEYFTIPVDTVYRVVVTAIARDANFDAKEFSGVGIIKNVGGTTSLVTAITMATSDQDAGMAGATMSVTADDANDRLAVKVTGILQSPPMEIHWFVKVAYIRVL